MPFLESLKALVGIRPKTEPVYIIPFGGHYRGDLHVVEQVIGDIMPVGAPIPCGGVLPKIKTEESGPLPASFQEHYDNAVKTLRSQPRGTKSAAFYAASDEALLYTGQKKVSQVQAPCHYALALQTAGGYPAMKEKETDWKPIILASQFSFKLEDKEQSLAFWDFITGSDSPWKALMQNGKPTPITDADGEMIGFSFTPHQLKCANFRFYKNFCIATRQVSENPNSIRMWYSLVKLGLDPRDAFLGCTSFSEYEDGKILPNTLQPAGGHWPITISEGTSFSYQTWVSGSICKDSISINGFFGPHGSFPATKNVHGTITGLCQSAGADVGMFTRTVIYSKELVKEAVEEFLKSVY